MTVRLAIVLITLAVLTGCRTPQSNTKKLGVIGGLAGAAAGAAIGAKGGDAVPGALIGGAIGAASGALVGKAVDVEEERNRAMIEEQLGRRLANAVSIPEVIEMTHAGLGDAVIVTHVRAHPVATPLNSNDLIALKQQGVSDPVINALQEPPPPEIRQVSAPVIVEEHYYGPPPCYEPRYHRHYHGPRSSFGISISN